MKPIKKIHELAPRDIERIIVLYTVDFLGEGTCGRMVGTSAGVVRMVLRNHNIKSRTPEEARKYVGQTLKKKGSYQFR